jgi:hypothetical protein
MTWWCPDHLCVQAWVACLYNLGKKMRLNVMPSCSDLASAAELALPLAVTSEVERYSSRVPNVLHGARRHSVWTNTRGARC